MGVDMTRMPPGRWDECVTRDRYECQAHRHGFQPDTPCHGRLVVHHRRLRSQGGTHDLENLVTLCDLHHRNAHDRDRADAEHAGIILRANATPEDSNCPQTSTHAVAVIPVGHQLGQPQPSPDPDPF